MAWCQVGKAFTWPIWSHVASLSHNGLISVLSGDGKCFAMWMNQQAVIDLWWKTFNWLKPRPRLNIKAVFPGMGIPMSKIRRSEGRLIFNLGMPVLVRRHLYIETAPWWHIDASLNQIIINSSNSLSPAWCQAITWAIADFGPSGTNISKIWIKVHNILKKKWINDVVHKMQIPLFRPHWVKNNKWGDTKLRYQTNQIKIQLHIHD